MRVQAFAKINLTLRVLGRRPDGYHELRTVFQSIALHDTLTIRRRAGPLRLTCDDPTLPCDRTNLVWRAAAAVWTSARRRGRPRDISIHLQKRIPMQAGLGGGSSDAAATLRALATLWRVEDERVQEAAACLGADVPYFLEGGTVLGLERGDVLYQLRDRARAWVVLVVPPFGIGTADAYRWWDAHRLGGHPINDLQPPVVRRHPEIARIANELSRAGASCAAMSGSGSTVFGLFPTRPAAARAADSLSRRSQRAWVTRTLGHAEYQRLAAN